MHIRFSNKIPKYSRVSVPLSIGQKSPAEQRFVGGVFALSVFYIGKAAGLLHCLRVSALFTLRLFWLIFNNRWLWSVGIRSFLWLQVRFPVRSLVLSPALRSYISALEASDASALDCCAWALETSALEALIISTRPSASPALGVLIRTLTERAV
jgi:hypothetical protein